MTEFDPKQPRSGAKAQALPQPQAWTLPDGVETSVDVISRAGAAIDDLIERNRAITDAAMRSVEHYRLQAKEVREENERLVAEVAELKSEIEALKAEREAMRVASEAAQADLEDEIESHRHELERAQEVIQQFNALVGQLLGNAEDKLTETRDWLPPL